MSELPNDLQNELRFEIPLRTALTLVLSAIAGALVAAIIIPAWVPGLASTLVGPEPKAYWYLSRAGGLVAFGLAWLSVALGLAITNRMARVWSSGPTIAELHEFASLLALSLASFHALILLGDRYANYSLAQLLLPFGGNAYRPLWVAAGQIGIYLSALVAFSVYVRRRIGYRAWRTLHYASFLAFAATLAHGVMAGTDTANAAVQGYYWATSGSVLFLFLYRVLARKSPVAKKAVAFRDAPAS